MGPRFVVALLALVLSCKKTPNVEKNVFDANVDPFAVDDSTLHLAGPIPLADGTIAMQHGEKYGALRFGSASLGPNGLFVHLTEKAIACGDWPDHSSLSLTLTLGAGPDGKFFAGKIATTHINGTRGFGHVKLDPFELTPGAHVTGRVAFSDPPWTHNGFAPKPSRAAGTFDVTLCPFSEADKAKLMTPSDLSATAPLSFKVDGASSAPKSVLLTVQWDGPDALPWVSDVEAYEQAGVTCETRYGASGIDMKVSVGLNPGDLGVDQPLRFNPDMGAKSQRESHVGWIRVEPFDVQSAQTAKGALVAFAPRSDTAVAKSLAGTFEARVCRNGSKLGKPYE